MTRSRNVALDFLKKNILILFNKSGSKLSGSEHSIKPKNFSVRYFQILRISVFVTSGNKNRAILKFGKGIKKAVLIL